MSLGIAMSGGGVKGAAHIGVIKALEENKGKTFGPELQHQSFQ